MIAGCVESPVWATGDALTGYNGRVRPWLTATDRWDSDALGGITAAAECVVSSFRLEGAGGARGRSRLDNGKLNYSPGALYQDGPGERYADG